MSPEQAELLLNRVSFLERQLSEFKYGDRYYFTRKVQLADGYHLQAGTSTGTKIGTSALQKLGFFGATPVVQQTAIGAPSSAGATYNQSTAQSSVDAINNIRTRLQALGFTA